MYGWKCAPVLRDGLRCLEALPATAALLIGAMDALPQHSTLDRDRIGARRAWSLSRVRAALAARIREYWSFNKTTGTYNTMIYINKLRACMGSLQITYIGMGGLVVCVDVWIWVCVSMCGGCVWGAPGSAKVHQGSPRAPGAVSLSAQERRGARSAQERPEAPRRAQKSHFF